MIERCDDGIDAIGNGIKFNIVCIPSKRNLGDALLRTRVNHGIMLPCLVSDEDFVINLIVDEPIGALSNRDPGNDGVGVCVNHSDLMGGIGRGEDQPKVRGDGDGVHIANACNVGHNFPGDGIEDNHRIRSAMCQVKQPGARIQIRVVKSVGTTSKRYIRNDLQRKRSGFQFMNHDKSQTSHQE